MFSDTYSYAYLWVLSRVSVLVVSESTARHSLYCTCCMHVCMLLMAQAKFTLTFVQLKRLHAWSSVCSCYTLGNRVWPEHFQNLQAGRGGEGIRSQSVPLGGYALERRFQSGVGQTRTSVHPLASELSVSPRPGPLRSFTG